MNIKIKILTALIISFSYIQVFSQDSLTIEKKLYGLSLIWQEVNYNFAYLNDSKVNWDSTYTATIPKVISASTVEEYYDALTMFLNVFHEGHTMVVKPIIKNSKYGVVSLMPYWDNGKYYIVGYSEEFKNKLKPGAEILEINGLSTIEYFDKFVFPLYNIPKISANEYLAFKLFYGKIEEPLKVKFKNPDAKIIELNIKRKKTYDDFITKPPKHKHNEAVNHYKIEEYDYVYINSFQSPEAYKQFDLIVDSLKNSKGIIIDLRSNSGGNSGFGTRIIQYFTTDTNYTNGIVNNRVNNSYYKALSVFNFHTENQKYFDYYNLNKFEQKVFTHKNSTKGELSNIPVVVLINGATVSAAESFIIELKRVKKITIIGTPSYGSTTLPLILSLPYGGKAYIASQMTLDENNNLFRHIEPDIKSSISVDNKLNGIDEVLNRAVDYLKKK